MPNIIGKATINPILFYSGKIAGYIIWIMMAFSLINRNIAKTQKIQLIPVITLLAIALFFVVIGTINLGRSTRLGIPIENTELKTNGLYKISRNPVYVGFNMLSLSAILFMPNIAVIALGIYSMVVYHLIILGEEKYLENRFSEKYLIYKQTVRRYL